MPDRLVPATLAFRDDGTLISPAYGDIYHNVAGALAQANYVFIAGNALPGRWQGRRTFTIVETGFGAGVNFLATWAAWRDDPARCERLHFVSFEKHPFSRDDLRLALSHMVANTTISTEAEMLADAWPMLVPGFHRLEFDAGRVVLTLALGDACEMLPKLVARADAFYLDGFAPAKNPDLWSADVFRALARIAAEKATFATYSSAGVVKQALLEAGFTYRKMAGLAGKFAMLAGEYAPRWRMRRHEPPRALPVAARDAIVIGAGLAGCAVVERLAARGWNVTLIERHARIASDASGNPAGAFHPLMTRDDNVASRLTRSGFLHALTRWRALEHAGHAFARSTRGMIHLAESADDFVRMRDAFDALGAPSDYVSLLDTDAARAHLNLPVAHGGLLFPHGGAVWPAGVCAAQVAAAGERVTLLAGTEVARLERDGDTWRAVDAAGATLAEAPVVVLANAGDAVRLAGLRHVALQPVRGQLTLLPPGSTAPLPCPAIGDGYAVPLDDGTLLIGATFEPDDLDPAMRGAGHIENIERVRHLLPGLIGELPDVDTLRGRVAFRWVVADRVPVIGPLADEAQAVANARALSGARARDLPRTAGLYGAFGYGSRGLVWAALGAELIASQLEGEPLPLERELADAVDPARFLIRALRGRQIG
ncbi:MULTISPECIES: bifunctional tRNA (5-methylaminomethyl-2-thiouridine)(34)-methyltransferase MnmD/FAD-dependent 5-carboxymethylaminomethyl-2-thiouridine(34) oxidoreductase MnmC [unclassified Burkholderia]|uniref:bifunctional tRNA (5-methylaminomethyl-2-thiouridine)(34)-methyltransferase MnmD/FAD-dependent 5-carboxymethylaminomethyl-2-thiouridine(34) oxidoreductase MnmC n=1 Tax=unclassified Burkholderia TaxID=2613784 RepID=UPI000F57435B|nr:MULTISPECIES: bifunctional tRNA (5-methylaminomethyl-2-thiouridine)(34)-methyltransferase MnmD/FAD-dependent 5-carboxymethylaminomethyl-2-thiouridine(34) oxidoreductase MnmC [unclassified Burkholderia]RQR43749.1 bifunctional tRNA (5-methylaminomethyl-2-thiouridine)(34)-methyltransferase MnmD/FAD-dependent 5-carboxymethylaminomethyl-2-thiouridine(34) oxidoreductase MnmC [Burkholderia sp. Bp9131]RQR75870.1 bifunctional tRNA (5-methylaminomethyl-2-thiouridine)(34)-methyltransferase MnmD/FAD-depen